MSKFYSHQIDMLKFSLSHPHCCYLADMGTGKTRPAIAAYYMRMRKEGIGKCLVVCPTTVLHNWQREINLLDVGLESVVIYGSKKKRLSILAEEANLYIINYDYLNTLKEQLRNMKFDMVIVDEITYVKNHTAQRSKALRYITKNVPLRIGLTGYPITNSPMDAFGEFLIIHPDQFGTNFWVFRNHYFTNVGRYFPMWIPIKSRLDKLSAKIGEHSIYVKKEDCLDLPDVVFETREIEMPAKMTSDYHDMKEHLVLELTKTGTMASARIVLTKIVRLCQITSGFINDETGKTVELGYNPKVEELKTLLTGELRGRKVIIWCRFIKTIEYLKEELKGYRPAVLYGKTKDRQRQIDKFNQDENCRVFIGQISIAFGFNLTISDTMIYVEHDFSIEKRQQSLGRNNRIGQMAAKLTVIDLVMKNSIDGYVLKSLEKKEDMANYIFDILGMLQEKQGVTITN